MPSPQKKGLSTGCIIIFVVGLVLAIGIAVLAVLASLGVASGRRVLGKAKELQAKATMKGLQIAIEGYKTEYNHLPLAPDPAPAQDGDHYDTSEERGRMLLDVLLGEDKTQNSRQVRFWEPPPSRSSNAGYTNAGGLIDPWGRNGYRIFLDDNGDGHIADPENDLGKISGIVLMYSAGPDGDFKTWEDNVCSWK
jgi:type II secretory pathway pseudopilin PulG